MAESGRGLIGDDDLEDWKILGSGGFALVFKAKHKFLDIDMAIKMPNSDDSSGTLYAALCREADYMKAAAQQYVPIVYGMYRGCPTVMRSSRVMQGIVMELMEGGCLQSFLKTKTQSNHPPWPLAFRLVHQVALAMDFLHCKNDLVHMDLKPANVLLDADFNAKIADFGLSTVTNSVSLTKGVNKGGTLSYTPPEAFEETYRCVRSYDVYSYGILLWTILTGKSPYPGVDQSRLMLHITRGGRPDLGKIDVQKEDGLEELVELMLKCWDSEPNNRPSFAECVEVTGGVFSRHKEGISAACDLLRPLPAPPGAPELTNRKAFESRFSVQYLNECSMQSVCQKYSCKAGYALDRNRCVDQNELEEAPNRLLEQTIGNLVSTVQPTYLVALSKVLANPLNTQAVRVAAGLQMKNALTSEDPDVKTEYQQRWLGIDANTRREIKNIVLQTLGTETYSPSSASQCVAGIACAEIPVSQWPELLPQLVANVT